MVSKEKEPKIPEVQLNGTTQGGTDERPSTAAPVSTKENTFRYDPYTESDAVKQAKALLEQQIANKPGAYQSAWQTQINDVLDKILNREKFSYDLNGDALYQQYKDQYTTQGKMAMMDTMGQAQAMTGGYGNSYAQSVGQQAYQGYLQQLNDRVPELYQLALDQYNREGDELYTQYGLYADRENQDYGRYRDQMSDYNTELDRLTNDARYQSEQDYGRYMDDFNIAYGQHRDQVSDAQWQAEFDEAKRQYDQQYELATGKSSGNGATGSSGYETDSHLGYDNEGISEDEIRKIQHFLGITPDGLWGAESMEAANGLGAKAAYEAWLNGELGNPVTGPSIQAIKNMQISLGVTDDGVWDQEDQEVTGCQTAAEAYEKWNKGQLDGAQRVNEGIIKNFMKKLHPEDQHDAVMRDLWGSYRQYVAYQIEHANNLTDREKAYLISYYGIQESDTNYKKH